MLGKRRVIGTTQTTARKNRKVMRLKKCYVVSCSFGQYDDYHIRIDGIFLNAADAEERKKEIEDSYQEKLDTPCPFKEEDLEYLTDEQLEEYDRWDMDRYYAEEFNGAEVKEYELQ